MKTRAAIVGATGYTGGELARLLLGHPGFELAGLYRLGSETAVSLAEAQPHLFGLTDLTCVAYDEAALRRSAQVVFFATPNGQAMKLAPALLEAGVKVIDLAADYRLHDVAAYRQWYKLEHASESWLARAIYGLPEVYREAVRKAELVANPGCYPTSAILALAPLLEARLVELSSLIVDSASGVSGAGRAHVTTSYLFSEVAGDYKAYGVAQHRHTPEIEQELSHLAGEAVQISFTPHLLPVSRGILTTAYATLVRPVSADELQGLYATRFAAEPFVRVRPSGTSPQLKQVVGSNFCDVSVTPDPRTGRVIALAAIDNLIKGAAGQAVQNANLMTGQDERAGLVTGALAP
ncbi:MAG: N-acetyl-gamma-glutamyl-phosphate reductase [Deltaproteobacteria bacterium]|nr:N-acetyl-gamma-glutamyl-phosphate reductase [Deltaproteobacteria bacterium]